MGCPLASIRYVHLLQPVDNKRFFRIGGIVVPDDLRLRAFAAFRFFDPEIAANGGPFFREHVVHLRVVQRSQRLAEEDADEIQAGG